jgi:hypothetical protein
MPRSGQAPKKGHANSNTTQVSASKDCQPSGASSTRLQMLKIGRNHRNSPFVKIGINHPDCHWVRSSGFLAWIPDQIQANRPVYFPQTSWFWLRFVDFEVLGQSFGRINALRLGFVLSISISNGLGFMGVPGSALDAVGAHNHLHRL